MFYLTEVLVEGGALQKELSVMRRIFWGARPSYEMISMRNIGGSLDPGVS
jgi:hypothetical protein